MTFSLRDRVISSLAAAAGVEAAARGTPARKKARQTAPSAAPLAAFCELHVSYQNT